MQLHRETGEECVLFCYGTNLTGLFKRWDIEVRRVCRAIAKRTETTVKILVRFVPHSPLPTDGLYKLAVPTHYRIKQRDETGKRRHINANIVQTGKRLHIQDLAKDIKTGKIDVLIGEL